MSLVCEVQLPRSGQSCGVSAIGRCHVDERPFCLTHAAVGGDGELLRDVCAPHWQRRRNNDVGDLSHLEHTLDYAVNRVRSAAAQLHDLGVPPEQRQRQVGTQRRLLRADLPIYETLEPAWAVGMYDWDTQESWNSGGRITAATGVTRNGDVVMMSGHTGRLCNELFAYRSIADSLEKQIPGSTL
jgi:hypothetical protein